MNRFIPREKLSKKAKRALDKQKRQSWSISPTCRITNDKTKYERKKSRRYEEDFPIGDVFVRYALRVIVCG